MVTGDPEVTAITMCLLLAHLTWNTKRLLGAMVLDRLDSERTTASKAVGRIQSGPTL
jgi:hypothetical protein